MKTRYVRWASSCLLAIAGGIQAADKPNILFIAVDDLRPELGCYGSEIAVSPNLDALAENGLLFQRAYCQQAICRPSRASLMTGARPDTTGLYHNYVALRELQPDIMTLPQHLIAHGYETVYCGKIFHQGDTDEENSWSRNPVPWIRGVKKPVGAYALAKNNEIKKKNMERMLAQYGEAARRGLGSGPAYENADVPDHAYSDGYETLRAIATMKEMVKNKDKPFFLALGFKKPHLNWTAPKRYWDLYDPEQISLTTQANPPENGAAMGLHASFELRTRVGIPKSGPIKPGWADGATVRVNGQEAGVEATPGTYARIERPWTAGDMVALDFPMEIKLLEGHPRIEEVRNQVAVKRGPIVYRVETPDLPKGTDILDVYLPERSKLEARDRPDFLGGLTTIQGDVLLRADKKDGMYRTLGRPDWRQAKAQFVPYFAWSNRGESEMTVWLPIVWE